MDLSKITKLNGKENKKKRLGRGYGSGRGGHTVGRGTKGQKARKSRNVNPGFEGGQVPLYKRLPRIDGFKNPRSKDVLCVNLKDINELKAGIKVTPGLLLEKGIISRIPKHGIKILSKGVLNNKLEFSGLYYSKAAKEKIEDSGSVIVS